MMKFSNTDCLSPFHRTRLHIIILSILFPLASEARVKFNYEVPEGFSAEEMDNQARYIINYHGKMLPEFALYSGQNKQFSFDDKKYQQAGLNSEQTKQLKKMLNALNISECRAGCDKAFQNNLISVDKTQRIITIRSADSDYLIPETHFGLVHNQNIDLRASSDNYRAANINANAWLGLPGQSFGYLNWFANANKSGETSQHHQDISSWYLQKNFQSTYLRTGKQNSLDFASGAVSTLLAPGYDRFVTVGSQAHLREGNSGKSLTLFASQEGNFEVYREGRLLLKRPANLGRNELDLNDLPGGYYSAEVRLVDRSGHILQRETYPISNVNFTGYQDQTVWHLTYGENAQDSKATLEAGLSKNLDLFYLNSTLLKGAQGRWASEVNVSRPGEINGVSVSPSLGVMSGERSTSGYATVSLSSQALGQLVLSRYLNNDISWFYQSRPSSSVYYSHALGNALLSYNYAKNDANETHQIESRWSFSPGSNFLSVALGVQKGGFMTSASDYSVYLTTTLTFGGSDASLNTAFAQGQTQLSGDVKHRWRDDFGQSSLGLTASHIDGNESVSTYATRQGTRGDFSASLGHAARSTNVDLNYRGMVAMNSDKIAMGRYSYSGAALLVDTPNIQNLTYGFEVEGAPVAGNGTYAVPVSAWQNIAFARVRSENPALNMDVEVPAYVNKAHPGQAYLARANVNVSAQYSGFLHDKQGHPVSGHIREANDKAYKNGLFSFTSPVPLRFITVINPVATWRCDLRQAKNSVYPCTRGEK